MAWSWGCGSSWLGLKVAMASAAECRSCQRASCGQCIDSGSQRFMQLQISTIRVRFCWDDSLPTGQVVIHLCSCLLSLASVLQVQRGSEDAWAAPELLEPGTNHGISRAFRCQRMEPTPLFKPRVHGCTFRRLRLAHPNICSIKLSQQLAGRISSNDTTKHPASNLLNLDQPVLVQQAQ